MTYNESLILPTSLAHSNTPPDTLLSWNNALESVDNFNDKIKPRYNLVYSSKHDVIHVYHLNEKRLPISNYSISK